MTIPTEMILMVVGGATSITTGIFWGAWYLGRLGNRIEWLTERVEEHDRMLMILREKELRDDLRQ